MRDRAPRSVEREGGMSPFLRICRVRVVPCGLSWAGDDGYCVAAPKRCRSGSLVTPLRFFRGPLTAGQGIREASGL